MSEFYGKSKSLAECYVFYHYLSKYYPTLQYYMEREFFRINDQTRKASKQVDQLRSMAAAEAQKEQKLLNTIFKANIKVDLQDEDSMSELISTINNYMNLKDVYNRNIQLIKNTKGQKSVISWFPTYFKKAWETGNYQQIIINHLNSVNLAQFETEADKIITQCFSRAVEEGIALMFNADVENSSIDSEYRDAYQQLMSAIGKVNQSNSLSQQLYSIYGLEEIKQALMKEISTGKQKRTKTSAIKDFDIKGKIEKDIHKRGGETLEAIENAIMSLVADEVMKVKDVRIAGALHTGQLGAKPDNILVFNMDPKVIEKALQTNEAVSRERNIQLFNELNNQIKNIDDGFIVYSSDKNYTFNENYHGFSSGTAITAENYRKIFSNIESNIDTFIGAMMQLGKGAIGQDRTRNFEAIIAQNVAYLLFDDFDSIGNVNNGNAIHVMNLNGVLIPLSFILTLLANAIENVSEDATRIVRAQISAPAILFPSIEKEREWVEANSPGNYHAAWDYQREQALKNTKIATHILLNFKQLIEKYGKSI